MKVLVFTLLFLVSCSTPFKNQTPQGMPFPSVIGKSLSGESWNLPNGFKGKHAILLLGYKQNSQFDIDRWLIGLDMKNVKSPTYEIPTIKGLFPRMFSTQIDNGMRRGIPKELWKGVITIYEDGEKVQKFTGNQNPNNARVILLDEKGVIQYFYDRGFSVSSLNELIEKISSLGED